MSEPVTIEKLADCICGHEPRNHAFERVGSLVALGECWDCYDCETFTESTDE